MRFVRLRFHFVVVVGVGAVGVWVVVFDPPEPVLVDSVGVFACLPMRVNDNETRDEDDADQRMINMTKWQEAA